MNKDYFLISSERTTGEIQEIYVSWWTIKVKVKHRSVMSDSLRPHGLQHTRPPCPSPTPRVHPNPCPLRWWCHPIISCSVIPFCSCLQSFPASQSFQMSQLFVSGGQSIGVSASTSVLPIPLYISHQQCVSDPISLCPYQHLVLSLFLFSYPVRYIGIWYGSFWFF